jgi:hypothetical protein
MNNIMRLGKGPTFHCIKGFRLALLSASLVLLALGPSASLMASELTPASNSPSGNVKPTDLQTLKLTERMMLSTLRTQRNRALVDPLGGLALGAALIKLGSQIQEAIERAVGGGIILEIQAGGQIALLIQQAQAAYEHELNLTWEKLNAGTQTIINSVFSAANELIDKTYQNISELQKRAQALVHTLPFSKNFPQAWNFGPSYAEPLDSGTLRFSVAGDFYDVPREGYDAVLEMNGHRYTNSEKSSAGLAFSIPNADLLKAPSLPVANPITITVPYRKTTFLFFKKKRLATFKATLASLPQRLGELTLAITTAQSGTTTQNKLGPGDGQESGDDDIKCGGEHADRAIHLAYPDTGWRVLPNSVTWNVSWSQGRQGVDQDWWLDRNCSTPLVACLCVSTEHHRFGTSGKVHFRIAFTQEKDVINHTTTNTLVNIRWGESRVVQIPAAATWTGTYKRFDGKTLMFAGPYRDNFIWVTQTANLITITTAPYNANINTNYVRVTP